MSGAEVIETIPRRGYRFVIPVTEHEERVGTRESELGVDSRQEATEASARPPAYPPPPTPYSLRKQVPAWLLWVSVLAIGGGAALLWAFLVPTAVPRVSHVVQLTHFGLASGVGTDGARLYVAEEKGGISSIAQVPLEGGDPVPIPTPFRNTQLLDVSPGRSELLVASFAVRGDPPLVWMLPLLGGSPRRLSNVVSNSAKWSPDGTKIAFQADSALNVINDDGTGVEKIADQASRVEAWSPDARLIRFTRTNGATGGESLWEVQTDGKNLRAFLPELQNPNARWGEGQDLGRWTPDGKYFLFREAVRPKVGIWAIQEKRSLFELRRPEPEEIYGAGFEIDSVVINPAGNRMYLVGKDERHELLGYDVRLRQFVPMLAGMPTGALGWSRDRQWLAYETPDTCLWKSRADGTARVQLTFPPMQAFGLAWSPDGQRIAFHTLSPGQPGKICLISAEGGNLETLLAHEATGEDVPNWSPDGNSLMFQRTWLDKDGNTTRSSICLLDMKTNRVSELPGSEDMGPPAWSSDGRFVAAQSGDFRQLMLFDFRSQHWTAIARAGFVNVPAWTLDGKYVYYQDLVGGEDQPIYRVGIPGGKVEEVASRKQLLRADVSQYRFAGLDPDGHPLAVIIRRNADVYALDLDLP